MKKRTNAIPKNIGFYINQQLGITWDWETEYRFSKTRRWRFDIASPINKVAIEIDGGIFARLPSHSSIKGILRDMEKLNHAQALGWRVFRYQSSPSYDGILYFHQDFILMKDD